VAPGFREYARCSRTLLANRERTLVEFLPRHGAYDQTTFPDEQIDAHSRPLAGLGGVRGALAHIRAMPQSAALNRKLSQRKPSMPVLAIGAELSFGARMAEGARQFADRVTGAVAERCGHWVAEERPVWPAQQIVEFMRAEQTDELASTAGGKSWRHA
jgi:pimeloyl-ACP methyl ester carboxylesterase